MPTWVDTSMFQNTTTCSALIGTKNATWHWQWALPVIAIIPWTFANMNCSYSVVSNKYKQMKKMCKTYARHCISWDMNFGPVWILKAWQTSRQTSRQKVMDKSPPCHWHRWAKKNVRMICCTSHPGTSSSPCVHQICSCMYASLLQLDLNAYTIYSHWVSNCNSQTKCLYAWATNKAN